MSKDILLDIGTTGARVATLEDNVVFSPEIFPREENTEEWIRSLISGRGDVTSLLAASTGLVRGGRIVSDSLGEVDLLRIAEEELGIPALVINDGHAAALAAARCGYRAPLLAIHIGTGMATGLWGDDLWLGQSGWAGESPFLLGGGMLQRTYEEISGKPLFPKEIVRLAREGEEEATRTMEDAARGMAEEIVRMIYFADPATVVISGGEILDGTREWILPAIEEALSGKALWQQMLAERSIEISPLGFWTPLYGAACLASKEPDFSLVL